MDTLLVVDDIPDNLRLLLNFLGKQGFKVLIGQDGKEAINTAEFAQPDLILLDVMMPGMDGFEVCKTLKNNETTKDIPIIFMTARTDSVDKLKGFELGAADYIGKPFEQEEVLARINTQLKLHKLHQQLLAEINRRKQAEISWQADRDGLAKSMVELRQLNADLTHATQVKDEFLANMSHELRAPLYVIFTISESLQEKNYGPLNDKQYQHIQTLKESGQHLLDLINDILDLAKIEADQLTLNIDTFSVNDVCEASLRMTKELAYKKRIRVLTTQDDMVGTIQADARRLKQILVNLLSNAVKFTPESGSIKLVVNGDVEHGMVDFSVEDTGMGIAENDRKRLFEPFVQLDSSLNQVQEGTGLGLSLVYRLTEMHGGSVSVESKVGLGSNFTVSLPWQPSHQNKPSLPKTTAPEKLATIDSLHDGAVILLAEDQKETVKIVSDYLSMVGYQVLIAQNGVDAVEQCRAKQPDLILMDIQMPVMSGLDAIKEIRAEPNMATIPIIALTALAMSGDRERCLSAGANDYLSKPVSMKKLVTAIEALLPEMKASISDFLEKSDFSNFGTTQ